MLIQRTTKSERLKNGVALDQLTFSLFDTNVLGFKRVLSEEGVFFGKTKMNFLSKLNTLFNKLKNKEIYGVAIHSGICIDTMPGCEVLEVRYALDHNLLDENGIYQSEVNSPIKADEDVIRFAIQLKDGKVHRLMKTGKFLVNKPCEGDLDLNYN